MEEHATYKLKLEGPGLSLDREVSEKLVTRIISLVFENVPSQLPMGEIEKVGGNNGVAISKASNLREEPSLQEFIINHNAARIPDKITAIGFYLQRFEGKKYFTRSDLVRAFEEASLSIPKNLSRDILWTIRNRWLAEQKGVKDSFYITVHGITAVKGKFPEEVIKKTRLKPSFKRRLNIANEVQNN